MSNGHPNSSPATVDWGMLRINDSEKTINTHTQKAIDKAVSSIKESFDQDLAPVKESLEKAERRFATLDFVRPYITWVPRLFCAAVGAAAAAICALGGWIGRLHGFW